MAINTERLYENAKEALRLACISVHDGDIENGEGLYKMMLKDPELYLRASDRYAWNNALPALEIFAMAKDALGKAKGGNAYNAVKRFIKGCPDARPDFQGVWYDVEGRQCMCDGYHAIRLVNPVEGFNAVKGMDLDKVFPNDAMIECELPMPTPGEVKIKSIPATSYPYNRKIYDFGDGLPAVDAKFLKNIMDCLPDAKVYATNNPYRGDKRVEISPVLFRSEKGDAILLPVRKKTA
jgi:hypothetical protein